VADDRCNRPTDAWVSTPTVAVTIPTEVAIHFGPSGTPDDYASEPVALALLPALLGLFALLPRIGPLGENIEAFRESYDGFVLVTLGGLALPAYATAFLIGPVAVVALVATA
jgi:uncharacterized membrane protein